jgi:hypothetical protein
MTRRVIDWISTAMAERYTEPEVHFHQGPENTPAPCYDARCGIPQLDVGTS